MTAAALRTPTPLGIRRPGCGHPRHQVMQVKWGRSLGGDAVRHRSTLGSPGSGQAGNGRVAFAVLATLVVLAAMAVALVGTPVAQAKPGGVDRTPVMGWSSWSFLRFGINTAAVEQEAQALVTSGLASAGYRYVNLDDGWYQCPGSQGPTVDQYGRWVIDSAAFPDVGSQNGIQALAAYVHSLGLRFGIYETAGISNQAVTDNSPILGTSNTADQIATTNTQDNYNCGGMVGINYSVPGAQQYV